MRAPFSICLMILGLSACDEAALSPDAGPDSPSDAGRSQPRPDAGIAFGEALTAPRDEAWHFIAFPDTHCADGSPAGIAVNLTSKSNDLVYFLEGGGNCWNAVTCAVPTALRLKGLGPDPLVGWLDGARGTTGIWNRSDPGNPFREWNFVNVAYCTGDSHLGDHQSSYVTGPIAYRGYSNVRETLKRVVPTFANAPRVLVAGSSAGGMGAAGNYDTIARAFLSVGGPLPFLVDDAGPVLRPPFLPSSMQEELRREWGFDGTVGRYCPACNPTDGYHLGWQAFAGHWPGMRGAFLSSVADQPVRTLYGLFNGSLVPMPPQRFSAGLNDFKDWLHGWSSTAGPTELHVFYYPGDRHMALEGVNISDTPGLTAFLEGLITPGAPWTDVTP